MRERTLASTILVEETRLNNIATTAAEAGRAMINMIMMVMMMMMVVVMVMTAGDAGDIKLSLFPIVQVQLQTTESITA